jgi:predicted DNA-binding transcriptional regulator AlpA
MGMTTRLMDGGLRSPEAAQRLGIRGSDVYKMLFEGELDGGPGRDGMVYFDEASIDAYVERHGFGVVAEPSTGSSTGSLKTGEDHPTRANTSKSRKRSSDASSDTDENGPTSGPSSS